MISIHRLMTKRVSDTLLAPLRVHQQQHAKPLTAVANRERTGDIKGARKVHLKKSSAFPKTNTNYS